MSEEEETEETIEESAEVEESERIVTFSINELEQMIEITEILEEALSGKISGKELKNIFMRKKT